MRSLYAVDDLVFIGQQALGDPGKLIMDNWCARAILGGTLGVHFTAGVCFLDMSVVGLPTYSMMRLHLKKEWR